MHSEYRKITDYQLRRVPRELREELFALVPKSRVLDMATPDLQHYLNEYFDRDDLYQEIAYDLNR